MITLETLRSGSVLRVSTRDAAALLGCSKFKLERDRVEGKGIPYLKDPDTQKVWYTPADILAHIDRAKPCTATVQYDNTAKQERLEKARAVLNKRKVLNGVAAAEAL